MVVASLGMKMVVFRIREYEQDSIFSLNIPFKGECCSENLHFEAEFGIFIVGDNIMKQFTPSEAKKLVKDILAQKKQKAEYFQAKGTLKGFAPAK